MKDRKGKLNKFAPPLSDDFYAESYRLRKAASSMTSACISWLEQNMGSLVRESLPFCDRPPIFSVLSVGSGEGDIDIEIIQNLIPHLHSRQMSLKYAVIEPNSNHRQSFQNKLKTISLPKSTEICIHDGYFAEGDSSDRDRHYHLILLIHVLYYFRDPYIPIQQALTQIEPTGKIVIVHQEETGIPQLQRQYMMSLKGDRHKLLTAEMIQKLLDQKTCNYF